MKKIILSNLIFFLAGLMSCKGNSNKGFVISGEIKNPGTIKKVYLIKDDAISMEEGVLVEFNSSAGIMDSALVDKKGRFKLRGVNKNIDLYRITAGLPPNIKKLSALLIVKNGDKLHFKVNGADTLETALPPYEVKGSVESDKLMEYNAMSDAWTKKNRSVFKSVEEGSLKKQAQIDKMLDNFKEVFDKQLLAFAKANRTYLAALPALMQVDRHKYTAQLLNLGQDMEKQFPENESVKLFVLQITDVQSYPAE